MSELFVTNVKLKLSVSKHDVGLSFRCWPARECTMAPNFTKHPRKLQLTTFSCRFFLGGMVFFFLQSRLLCAIVFMRICFKRRWCNKFSYFRS